jgi:LacI family transcriptional regulator
VAPTIEDVARRAGVSRQTVSRVINGRNWVSAEARESVLEAVRELGYRRNALAGSLRSGRTNTIGLLISNILNPLFAGEVRGVQDVADGRDYQVILANTDEDVLKEQRLVQMLREQHVDGAIVIPCHSTSSRAALEELARAVIPVVLLNRRLPGFDCVAFDSTLEAEQAISHLVERGHRRIAIITGPRRSTTARDRLSAYRRVLERNGLEYAPELVITPGWSETDGAVAAHTLLNLPVPPTAIFTSSVLLTLGAVTAIKAAGLRIPQDMALIGCNENRWSQIVDPPLTMIQTDPYALGRTGAELLFRRLDGDRADAPALIRLPAQLEVRQSSGARVPARRLRPATGGRVASPAAV